LLLAFTRGAVRHPWRVLAAAAVLTAGATALATRLEIRSSFEELLPKDLPSVTQIRELSRRVGGDGNVLVNVESLEGPAGLSGAQPLAKVLARELLALGADRVRSVEFDVGEIQPPRSSPYSRKCARSLPPRLPRRARAALRRSNGSSPIRARSSPGSPLRPLRPAPCS